MRWARKKSNTAASGRVARQAVVCHRAEMDLACPRSSWTLDRASLRRADEAWILGQLENAESCFLPLWRDHIPVDAGERPQLVALRGLSGQAARALAEETVFLGTGEGGQAWFACDITSHDEERLAAALRDCVFRDLGRMMTLLAGSDGHVIAYARSILHWHRRHRFCGACGSRAEPRQGGHLRVCTNADCRLEQFPRIDPVVIMLVTRLDPDSGAPVCLLGRQKHWVPGLMSALAGFVEPGETLEDAVRREVREEAGLGVADVRYQMSQPWPFPTSLMLGFRAEADAGQLMCQDQELEEARWFRRDEVRQFRALGLRLPFRGTIARALVEGWLAEGEARQE